MKKVVVTMRSMFHTHKGGGLGILGRRSHCTTRPRPAGGRVRERPPLRGQR